MVYINMARDFTKTPGGRTKNQGPRSGELFYEEVLLPKFIESLEKGKKLEIDFNGTYGLPPSFIEGSFAVLYEDVDCADWLRDHIKHYGDYKGALEMESIMNVCDYKLSGPFTLLDKAYDCSNRVRRSV